MRTILYWHCLKRLLLKPPRFEVIWNVFAYWLNKNLIRSTRLRHYPLSIVLYMTKRCNYHCSFCYAEPVLERSNKATDLSLEQFRKLMDTPFGRKALRVGLLGGEPFLNKDIFKIIEELKDQRKVITVVSNASLIQGEILENLLASRLDLLGLSLYSNNRQHVSRVIQAIEGKIQYWVQTVVSCKEIQQLESIIDFCLSLGCRCLQLSNCVPSPSEQGMGENWAIYEDNQEYLNEKKRLTRKYESSDIKIEWINLLPRDTRAPRACAMPFSYVHIDSAGSLGACCMRAPDEKLYGNIFRDRNVWNAEYYVKLRKSMFDSSIEPMDMCKGCDNLHRDLYRI